MWTNHFWQSQTMPAFTLQTNLIHPQLSTIFHTHTQHASKHIHMPAYTHLSANDMDVFMSVPKKWLNCSVAILLVNTNILTVTYNTESFNTDKSTLVRVRTVNCNANAQFLGAALNPYLKTEQQKQPLLENTTGGTMEYSSRLQETEWLFNCRPYTVWNVPCPAPHFLTAASLMSKIWLMPP